MRSNSLVSVIIPTYNRAGPICQTVENVFQQTYRNMELIVVDDGSTDDTQSRLRPYGNRLRIITQANAGPAVARNRGVAVARGDIIAFQDSDDLWKPTKLERQVALLEKAGCSVPCCLCNAVMRVVEGKQYTSFDNSLIHLSHEDGIWLNVLEVLATRFVLFNQAIAIRKEVFEKLGGFDESLKYLEDYDLPLRLALEGPWALIREPLVIYREGSPESFSRQALKDPVVLKECELKIFRRVLAKVGDGDRRASIQGQLKRRLRTFRRGVREIKVRRMGFPGAKTIGALLSKLGHLHAAAYRRSPWFPKAITVPMPTWGADHPISLGDS